MNSLTRSACDWLRQHSGEAAVKDFQMRRAAGQSIETALCAVTTLTKRQAKALVKSNFGYEDDPHTP